MHSKDKKREQLINEYFDLFRERVEPERHQLGLKLKHPLVEEFPEQLRLFLETRSELQTTVLEYAWHVYELHKMAYSCTTTDSAKDYWAELFVCLLDAKRHILTEYPDINRPLIRRLIYPNFEELTAPDIECGVKKAHWDKQNDKLALFEKAMAAADEQQVPDEFKPRNDTGQKMKDDGEQIDELYLSDIIRIADEVIKEEGWDVCVDKDENATGHLCSRVSIRLKPKQERSKPDRRTIKKRINKHVLSKK